MKWPMGRARPKSRDAEFSRDAHQQPIELNKQHIPMDLKNTKYLQASPIFSYNYKEPPPLEGDSGFYNKNKDNPFGDTFQDPLCKLNLKETSEFVKSFPMQTQMNSLLGTSTVQGRKEGMNSSSSSSSSSSTSMAVQRRLEAPPTPGRPVFCFSGSNNVPPRKSFPSKWDDAEKWLISSSSSSCHDSPAHVIKPTDQTSTIARHSDVFLQKGESCAEKTRLVEEKVSKAVRNFHGPVVHLDPPNSSFSSTEVTLKDKFTDNVEPVFPNFRYSEPAKEGFLFRNSACETMKDAATEVVPEVRHRDIESSNNTAINISELQECHLAKLELVTQFDSVVSNWSSREEEEEEVSKSLRHCETDIECRKKITLDSRGSVWEEEERTKFCIRYQREEAKIQAWVNLQSAKAEAESRKLEVKIQKMRSNLEEKLMKRMAVVQRKAEEWRASAQQQHSLQNQRAAEQAQKMKNQQRHKACLSDHTSCSCFPCNNHRL
ncbi:hypothetical protein Syun_026675 [Stephania yunnanensis]|uniref:Remorin C-terminal domain-containing protein n=1 Tax=Stephania yunnanensis TaxID=152371 RepID=A0AAP0HX80_9MAGN